MLLSIPASRGWGLALARCSAGAPASPPLIRCWLILGPMTKTELKSEALQLPVEDRLGQAEALWESLDQEPVQPELPAWQREVLDERLAADEAEPDAGSPWEEVKQSIFAKL